MFYKENLKEFLINMSLINDYSLFLMHHLSMQLCKLFVKDD